MKTIGIIGAGNIGAAFARALAKHHIPAVIANSRGPESLASLVRTLGSSIRAGTREEAAAQDIVLVAVNWSKLPAALAGLPDWQDRIVIDANNPIEAPLFQPADLGGRASSEIFSGLVPGARVVKAFNHLLPPLLSGDPRSEGVRRRRPRQGGRGRPDRATGLLRNRPGLARNRRPPGAVPGRSLARPEPGQVRLKAQAQCAAPPTTGAAAPVPMPPQRWAAAPACTASAWASNLRTMAATTSRVDCQFMPVMSRPSTSTCEVLRSP